MTKANNAPSAEKILTLLYDLYADQMGVKVTITFDEKVKDDDRKSA